VSTFGSIGGSNAQLSSFPSNVPSIAHAPQLSHPHRSRQSLALGRISHSYPIPFAYNCASNYCSHSYCRIQFPQPVSHTPCFFCVAVISDTAATDMSPNYIAITRSPTGAGACRGGGYGKVGWMNTIFDREREMNARQATIDDAATIARLRLSTRK